MFALSNFIRALASIIDIVLSIYYWLIIIRALISWVNPDPHNVIVQFLYRATEPLLHPIRRMLPQMGIDVSPIIAFLVIIFLKGFVVATLIDISYRVNQYPVFFGCKKF